MKKVKHKNIIEYYNSFFSGEALYIVMEYAMGGDMHDVSVNVFFFKFSS